MRRQYASAFVIALLATIATCSWVGDSSDPQEDDPDPIFEEARKKRERRIEELQAMDIPALARELEVESQSGGEPFNSLAFADVVKRDPRLVPLVTRPDRSSLFGLLALRAVSRDSEVEVDLRVAILVDALKASTYFNTWGLPHTYAWGEPTADESKWGDATGALIATGSAAQGVLEALLDDKREAPVWHEENELYQYRVCDYAWVMLNKIAGREITIPLNPAERDVLIQEWKSASGGSPALLQ